MEGVGNRGRTEADGSTGNHVKIPKAMIERLFFPNEKMTQLRDDTMNSRLDSPPN